MRNVERRFSFRSPKLFDLIVGLTREAGEDGIGWVELLARADPEDKYSERTIEGGIRDLAALGMLSIGGRSGSWNKPNARRVWISPLGEAALDGVVAVLPWNSSLT